MDLYGFGFNGHYLFRNPSQTAKASSTDSVLTPKHIIQSDSIKVLWTSWCDALVLYTRPDPITQSPTPMIHYTGLGLTPNQLQTIKNILRKDKDVQIFGADLADGIRGLLRRPKEEEEEAKNPYYTMITFFSSEHEIALEDPDIEMRETETRDISKLRVRSISMENNGSINIARDIETNPDSKEKEDKDENKTFTPSISHFTSPLQLKTYLDNPNPPLPHTLIPNIPTPNNSPNHPYQHLTSNSISTTALSSDGKVYTWATDQRYPKCLGRDTADAPAHIPAEIPFLSETEIVKIASGGYMTAALSADGELFLWGQACPGIKGELYVLKTKQYKTDTSASDEDSNNDEDEFVKCVDLHIQGKPAIVTDVAIGSGHILVAAEVEDEGVMRRAVFAAGQCEYGQLGNGTIEKFVPDFVVVRSLVGRRVVGLAAAGWSSWVAVEGE